MDRPAGITLLAVLDFIAAFFCVLGALFLFIAFGFLGPGGRGVRHGAAGMAMFLGVGAATSMIFLFIAGLLVVAGVGLWKLRSWARILTIALAGIGVLFCIVGILLALLHFHVFILIFRSIVLGIYLLILWYMFQSHVKQAFGAPSLGHPDTQEPPGQPPESP